MLAEMCSSLPAVAALLEEAFPRCFQQRSSSLHAQLGLRELHHPALGLPPLDTLDDYARSLDGINLDIHQLHDDFATIALQARALSRPAPVTILEDARTQFPGVARLIAQQIASSTVRRVRREGNLPLQPVRP